MQKVTSPQKKLYINFYFLIVFEQPQQQMRFVVDSSSGGV